MTFFVVYEKSVRKQTKIDLNKDEKLRLLSSSNFSIKNQERSSWFKKNLITQIPNNEIKILIHSFEIKAVMEKCAIVLWEKKIVCCLFKILTCENGH